MARVLLQALLLIGLSVASAQAPTASQVHLVAGRFAAGADQDPQWDALRIQIATYQGR